MCSRLASAQFIVRREKEQLMTFVVAALIFLLGFQSGVMAALAARLRRLVGMERDRHALAQVERAMLDAR